MNYYKMNTDGTTYSLFESNIKLGETNSKVQISSLVKDYEGFTFEGGVVAPDSLNNPKTYNIEATVLGDKSTVINMYYERNKYEVKLEKDSGVDTLQGIGSYFFNEVVSVGASMLPGYSFLYWSGTIASFEKDFTFNMPSKAVSLKANIKVNEEVNFTVNHYKIKEDKSGYELAETENLRNISGNVLKLSDLAKSYSGFSLEGGKATDTATEIKPASFDVSVTLSSGNTLVINLYYGPYVAPPSGGGGGGGGGGSKTPSIVISDTTDKTKTEDQKAAEEVLKKIEIKNGKVISLPEPEEVKKEGYKFLGYFYDEKFTKPVKVGDKITGDMNFFAQ
ncbi:MAG: hypothetical protein MJ246_07010 [Clostridia bacterium]|nr:hypothetical protein [Clostridia bacterium]